MKHGLKLYVRNMAQWSKQDNRGLSSYVYDTSGKQVGHVCNGVFSGMDVKFAALYVPGGDYRAKWPNLTLADCKNTILIMRRTKALHGGARLIYPRLP